MKNITEKNIKDIRVGMTLYDTEYRKFRTVTAIKGQKYDLEGIVEHESDIIKHYKIK